MRFYNALKGRIFTIFGRMGSSQALVLGFVAIIFAGAVLLNLPAASRSGRSIGFLDALFMSASAVCVTGLTVVNTAEHWTVFGKTVLLCLIQVGGLGFMTFALAIIVATRRKITFMDRLVVQAAFNLNSTFGIVSLVKKIILGTLLFEGVGAVILSVRFFFDPGETFLTAAAKGIFHSVSAFCNAGFDTIGRDSLMPYVDDVTVNVVISALTIIGGIGFIVWIECINIFKMHKKHPKMRLRQLLGRFSLHSKIAISSTGILIVIGAVYIFFSEFHNPATLEPLEVPVKIMASFFHSIMLRTTGFYTLDISMIQESTNFINLIMMFIGGSPAGTAGGVKTVTMGIVFFSTLSVIRGRDNIEGFRRSIPIETLGRALVVIFLMIFSIISAAVILTFSEYACPIPVGFLDILIEAVSACTTVGHTTGITQNLSVIGKTVIMVCMFIGRMGPVTLAAALGERLRKNGDNIRYPDEKVLVG